MRHVAFALSCALLFACAPPSDPAGWAKEAYKRNRLDEKLHALEMVRKAPGEKKAAVPFLLKILEEKQHPRARAAAALAIGEAGDPTAIDPLMKAIDTGAKERDAMEMDRRIAEALGALKAVQAVDLLGKLTTFPDAFVQVAAVDALGAIGDKAAVDVLTVVAMDPQGEPFTSKKATLALGRIGDPKSMPVILKLMFISRGGVSFFPEAAFAASQIGPAMIAPLLKVLEGQDAELAAWAREQKYPPGALYAKAASVLGDVGDASVVPALVKKLSYTDPDAGIQLFVRVYAAEALGRLRAREAVRPLADALGRERNPDARDRLCDALARIGDPAALPTLKAAASGDWDSKAAPLTAISRLGGEGDRATIAAAQAACGQGCPAEQKKALAGMLARLDAAKACDAQVACWSGRLGDSSAAVRDRAALEVGRTGTAAEAAALGDAIVRKVDDDEGREARYHAVLALGWIAKKEALEKRTIPAGAAIAEKIDAMILQDKGRKLVEGVNEDAMRVALRLERAAGKPAEAVAPPQ
jgi:HEAT repeat protein